MGCFSVIKCREPLDLDSSLISLSMLWLFHFNAINSFCSKLENNLKHFQSGAPKKKKKKANLLCVFIVSVTIILC